MNVNNVGFYLKYYNYYLLYIYTSQNCKLEFLPWSRSKKEVIVQYNKQTLVDNHTIFHTEWEIIDINVTNNELNDFVWLEYNLLLK